MLKSFTYRLYPTKRQQRLLSEQLEEVRWLWNTLLAERKQAWEERREAVDYYEQKAELLRLKAALRPGLKQVHSQVAQDVALRLKKAMDTFFRRLKTGESPGYPRFRGTGRYDSLTYPQWENGVRLSASGKRLMVAKVGDRTIIVLSPTRWVPKTATMRRTVTGTWFTTITCEWEPTPLPATGRQVGIDVGLTTFATRSNGVTIANPRFFRREKRALARAQRRRQVALDPHKATRAGVTERVKQAHPELDETDLWQAVSQDPEERALEARGLCSPAVPPHCQRV